LNIPLPFWFHRIFFGSFYHQGSTSVKYSPITGLVTLHVDY